MTWAFEQPINGNEKCVLLALADHARDDGLCWPGHETIATKAHVSTKTVCRILGKLEEKGYIVREERRRGDGLRTTDLIRLRLDTPSPDTSSGDKDGGGQQTAVSEQNPKEPSSLSPRGAVRKPVTYQKRRVPELIVKDAEQLLTVFEEVADRRVAARTADGAASPALKQVIGAMLARTHVTLQQWDTAIRNTAANPPGWVDGPLLIGHVFGERAADVALANDGRPRPARGQDPAKAQRDAEAAAAWERFGA